LYPILAVNFVGALGFSIVLPFLVYLVTRLGGNALVYGVLGATYSFFQLLGAPILGRWSDRHGRRRILLLSQVGTLASWGIFLVALALPERMLFDVDSALLGAFTVSVPLLVLFLARALDGATGGNVSVANAYLADITPDQERSTNFGKMAMSSNLGFILGPAIAGVLGATAAGETLPVFVALLISVVAVVIIAVALPESDRCRLTEDPEPTSVGQILGPDQKQCYEMQPQRVLSMLEILRLPSVGLVLAVHFLVFLAFNLFYIAFPVHAATGIGWSLAETGIFFSVLGALMAFVQGPVLARLARRWSDRALVLVGSAILATSFPLLGTSGTPSIYAGAALLALGNGVMWPSLLAVLSTVADQRVQGAVQGIAGSSSAVASITGLLVGGVLYNFAGAGVFAIAAAITVGVVVLALAIPKPPRQSSSPITH
jgi:MFS family permease